MAKEDLKLRVTSNPPLTTKGSALTWVELDANWIEIYNAYVALSQSSYVDAYSAAVTYDDTINNYVMYSSQIWKCIAASPIIAITPVEGVNWTAVYATDMVNRPLPIDGIKRYKALLSQNAPIASQTSGTVIVGQIWSITTYVAGDDFSNWTLVSGTGNTTGDVYQATTTAPTTWTNSSDLAYDGRPYIVSTDANGVLNPFVNTLGDISFGNYGTGEFYIIFPELIDIKKTSVNIIGNGEAVTGNGSYYIDNMDKTSTPYYCYFSTRNNITDILDNNLIQYDLISIKVNP